MPHANEVLVRRMFSAFCALDSKTLHSVFADDVKLHYPGHSVLAGDHRGIDAVEKWVRFQLKNKKVHTMNVGAFADDERAVMLYVQDIKHGGKTAHDRCVAVCSFRDGRISEVWVTPMDLLASDAIWGTAA